MREHTHYIDRLRLGASLGCKQKYKKKNQHSHTIREHYRNISPSSLPSIYIHYIHIYINNINPYIIYIIRGNRDAVHSINAVFMQHAWTHTDTHNLSKDFISKTEPIVGSVLLVLAITEGLLLKKQSQDTHTTTLHYTSTQRHFYCLRTKYWNITHTHNTEYIKLVSVGFS